MTGPAASDDIVEMSTFRDETLDTDDLTALESVYKELLGLVRVLSLKCHTPLQNLNRSKLDL